MTERDSSQQGPSPTVRDRAAPPSSQNNDDRADLGILMVHGIGQSREGETLVRFGEPLVSWIVGWVDGAASADVETLDAVLGAEVARSTEPARTRLKVTAPALTNDGQRTTEWLIAESWWAESFVVPSFAELAKWGLKVAPWTVLYHFRRRFARALSAWRTDWRATPRSTRAVSARAINLVLEFLWLVVALILAPVLVVAIGLLLILGLFPIPRLRRFVAWVQRGLALTIGDSYALLGSKISSAAIYGKVTRDLAWLAQRSKKIAVVAHSQGAALAYRVVSRDRSGQCELLVTFGSGLRKLAQIRQLESVSGAWVWLVSTGFLALAGSALVSQATLGTPLWMLLALLVPAIERGVRLLVKRTVRLVQNRGGDRGAESMPSWLRVALGLLIVFGTASGIAWLLPVLLDDWASGLGSLSFWKVFGVTLMISISWGALIWGFEEFEADNKSISVMSLPEAGRATPAKEEPLPEVVHWMDFYAVSDPVPNGAMFDGQPVDPLELKAQSTGLESFEVRNRASPLSDHISYTKNCEDFLAPLAAALGEKCGLNLGELMPFDRERLIVARHSRKSRVGWLHGARLTVVGTFLTVYWTGSAETLSAKLFSALSDAVRDVHWINTLLANLRLSEHAVEGLTVALGGAVAYGLVNVAWLLWDWRSRVALVGRYVASKWAPARLVPFHRRFSISPSWPFHFSWLICITAGVILIFDWTAWPWWAYLLGLPVLDLVASRLARTGRERDILVTWEEVQKRLGLWTEEVKEGWLQTVEAVVDRLYKGAIEPKPAIHLWSLLVRSASTDVERAEAHFRRAQLYDTSGEIEKAIADYTAVVGISDAPANQQAGAYAMRGWLAYRRGDFRTFLSDTQEAVKQDPEPFWIGFNLALAELLGGKTSEAQDRYRSLAEKCTEIEVILAAAKDLKEALERQTDLSASVELLTILEARLEEL